MTIGFNNKETKTSKTPLVDSTRFTHALCIGQTGSGKTSGFIYPNLEKRVETGHGILFFDIKGSEHRAVKYIANRSDRLKDVIEIGKPWGEKVNILDDLTNKQVVSLINNIISMPADGGSNTYFYTAARDIAISVYYILYYMKSIRESAREIKCDDFSLPDNVTSLRNVEIVRACYDDSFSLREIYTITRTLDSMYAFYKTVEAFHESFLKNFLEMDKSLLQSKPVKKMFLNYKKIENLLKSIESFNIPPEERNERQYNPSTLSAVLGTLEKALSFINTPSGEYLTSSSGFSLNDALTQGKIVIINVRVIPDRVLKNILEKLFEKLIDRNLVTEALMPITIFIDEAQRLVDKSIPLDVLRSSKVDVVMAIQSEQQFLSKLDKPSDWLQLSDNIHEKISFHTTGINEVSVLEQRVDPATLDTFEYITNNSNGIQIADPFFINKKDLLQADSHYQNSVLKIPELGKGKLLDYEPSRYEKEHEVVKLTISSGKRNYVKWFTPNEEVMIDEVMEELEVLMMFKDTKSLEEMDEDDEFEF